MRPGKASREMMGGCLSLFVTTLGTPYEIDTRGKLLFLEDVGEKPYRVESMLTHLKMAGKFDGLAGVLSWAILPIAKATVPGTLERSSVNMFRDAPIPWSWE